MGRFSATFLEHLQSPLNADSMSSPDAVGIASLGGYPPRVVIFLRLHGETVEEATFRANGCGATIACCSALTELIARRSIADCRGVTVEELGEALDGIPPDKRYCAVVAIGALHNALASLDPPPRSPNEGPGDLEASQREHEPS